RRGVELKRVTAFLHREAGDVGQGGLLCLPYELQERAGGRNGEWQIVRSEAAQIERAELVGQQARGARELEMPRRPHALGAARDLPDLAVLILRHEEFGRLQTLELGLERGRAVDF